MVSCVKNVRKFLNGRCPTSLCIRAWQEALTAATVAPVWQYRAPAASPVYVHSKTWAGDTQLFDAPLLCLAWTASLVQSNLDVTVLTGRSRGTNCSKSYSVWRGKKLFLAQTSFPVMGHEPLCSKWTPAEFTEVSRLWITFMQLISRNLISRYLAVQTTQILQGEMPQFQLLFLNCTCVREGANKIELILFRRHPENQQARERLNVTGTPWRALQELGRRGLFFFNPSTSETENLR